MLQEPRTKPCASAEAFAYCQRIALNHYENFTVASWLLPKEARRHVYAVYAFCRHTDDLGDEAPSSVSLTHSAAPAPVG